MATSHSAVQGEDEFYMTLSNKDNKTENTPNGFKVKLPITN